MVPSLSPRDSCTWQSGSLALSADPRLPTCVRACVALMRRRSGSGGSEAGGGSGGGKSGGNGAGAEGGSMCGTRQGVRTCARGGAAGNITPGAAPNSPHSPANGGAAGGAAGTPQAGAPPLGLLNQSVAAPLAVGASAGAGAGARAGTAGGPAAANQSVAAAGACAGAELKPDHSDGAGAGAGVGPLNPIHPPPDAGVTGAGAGTAKMSSRSFFGGGAGCAASGLALTADEAPPVAPYVAEAAGAGTNAGAAVGAGAPLPPSSDTRRKRATGCRAGGRDSALCSAGGALRGA